MATGDRIWRTGVATVLSDTDLANIDSVSLAEKLGLSPVQAKSAHDQLIKEGILVRVGDMHVYRKTIQYIGKLLYRRFQQKEGLSVAEFRDMLNTSRKVALPLMGIL